MNDQPERPRLTPQLRRDALLDVIGNTALAFGLWGWHQARSGAHGWLAQPALFIPLMATGLLNLIHLPARLRRLREWRDQLPPR
ncbi:MAG TPA: hypothetical protein VFM34_06490 [Moraxellaceae bacterium]|nr:hypothetical protein [Moraxellaceae bacterium]